MDISPSTRSRLLRVARILGCVFCIVSLYFAWVHRRDNYEVYTQYQEERDALQWNAYCVFRLDPYWSAFRYGLDNISGDSLLTQYRHGALYRACWQDSASEGLCTVTYYRDCRDRCLMVSQDDCGRLRPYDAWHYIDHRGLVRFDIVRFLADLHLAICLYILPALLLLWLLIRRSPLNCRRSSPSSKLPHPLTLLTLNHLAIWPNNSNPSPTNSSKT